MLKTDLNSDCVTYSHLVGMAANGERGHLMGFHGWDGNWQGSTMGGMAGVNHVELQTAKELDQT